MIISFYDHFGSGDFLESDQRGGFLVFFFPEIMLNLFFQSLCSENYLRSFHDFGYGIEYSSDDYGFGT